MRKHTLFVFYTFTTGVALVSIILATFSWKLVAAWIAFVCFLLAYGATRNEN